MVEYSEFTVDRMNEVKDIFRQEGWCAYLSDDEALRRAFANSLLIFGAFDGENLIGFIRCVGDGEHIVLVQDLIVRQEYRKRGIGKALFSEMQRRFGKVRMFCVTTDLDDEADNRFYRSFGMKPLEDGHMITYFRV